MHQMLSPSVSFQLRDVSTGEPHLYCTGSLTDRRYLAHLERDPQERRFRTSIALHLPRLTAMACAAAALLFGAVALAKAEGLTSAASLRQMSAACAERDLRVVGAIEEHGASGDMPASLLGELGLMQLQARLSCIAGEESTALATYDDILGAVRLAERVRP